MIGRLLSALLLLWIAGFVTFVAFLPRPAPGGRTDAIIVLTGGPGRIEHGLDLLRRGQARRLLVSGVDLSVARHEFQAQFPVPPRLFACCVTLGQEAVDTRSNGAESAAWIARHRVRSVRLVTTDWHMRRARLELDRVVPAAVRVYPDAIRSEPDLRVLLLEYHKYLLRRLGILFGF